MKRNLNKRKIGLTFFVLAFALTLGSCAKRQVKKDIEGTWEMTEFLVNGEIFWMPSTNDTWHWTFDDGTLSTLRFYMDGGTPITEAHDSKYRIKDGGKTLWLGQGDERTITELTSSKLVISWEGVDETAVVTFVRQ